MTKTKMSAPKKKIVASRPVGITVAEALESKRKTIKDSLGVVTAKSILKELKRLGMTK